MSYIKEKNLLIIRKKIRQVQNKSKLAVSDESSEKQQQPFSLGKEANKLFDKVFEFVGSKSSVGLEGFQQVSEKDKHMTKKHKAHFENLQEMENKLNRLITEYSAIHKGLMDETNIFRK